MVKNPPTNAGDIRDLDSILRSGGSPGGGQPIPVFLPGEFHGQRRLVGYSPWRHKELDTTEPRTLSLLLMLDLSITFLAII